MSTKRRSAEVISRNMAAVRARDSKAELLLRRGIWRRGYRFRICRADLPGKPDLSFGGVRLAVFVDGDFWHARVLVEQGADALRASLGNERTEWWLSKLTRNAERDREVTRKLESEGWRVLRLWERDILRDPEKAVREVIRRVEHLRRQL